MCVCDIHIGSFLSVQVCVCDIDVWMAESVCVLGRERECVCVFVCVWRQRG